ncbi:MAG TPA: hypothetical protein VJA18_04255 [Candidatus Nanoarchaeia archaeon]|nr:hypothetical protein [Candidatus Nanoarchaeia archaeon]
MKEKVLDIDYYMNDGYVLNVGGRFVTAGEKFNDLFAILAGECKFGTSIEKKEPVYRLILGREAKILLEDAESKLLEALVNYHNNLVGKAQKTEDNS